MSKRSRRQRACETSCSPSLRVCQSVQRAGTPWDCAAHQARRHRVDRSSRARHFWLVLQSCPRCRPGTRHSPKANWQRKRSSIRMAPKEEKTATIASSSLQGRRPRPKALAKWWKAPSARTAIALRSLPSRSGLRGLTRVCQHSMECVFILIFGGYQET